ncbi:FAD-dependent oxidoreductase [Kutzneria buriramensis]|uniref:2-polyprenyl-6-methoxyphenol hydroxylase-like FAD-dependent oxidoreductase n=1 Tax=Kutzneria buriramensis TaxID=1045776 RepID=A0A3E0HEP4_9PSEU|nr:FAD-dependent oxidoreductase [Kutzneria buriramensis]REH43678.1 2-polyprenyl-6-methoxyphenol hydroxylase-like FAD-dependent oxidoreductase [Kutzneria buriramensis]
MTDVTVLVVGGGPVGLFLAAELRLAGVTPLVVERTAAPGQGKGDDDRGLSARTVQTLDLRGLGDLVRAMTEAALRRLAGFSERTAAEDPRDLAELLAALGMADFKGDFAMLPLIDRDGRLADLAPPLMVMQGEFERLLAERVADLGVEVRRGVEVVDVEASEFGVTAVLADGGRTTADWLVGCDGGRSVVRRRAGFDFPGTEPSMLARGAVATYAELPFEPGIHRLPGGILAASPAPGPSMTIEFDPAPFDRESPLTADEFETSLRRVSGRDIAVTEIAEPMRITDNARQTSTYRRGRVLLAGDAAHVHSPIGGQGLNLGIQDAANLGWKLALVARGLAGAELLDTYTAERHPVGAQVLRDSRAESALLRTDPHTEALRGVLGDVLQSAEAARTLLELNHGLRIRYGSAENPLIGTFATDVKLLDGRGRYLGPDTDVVAAWADRVDAEQVSGEGRLVRPDGYIAWAGGDPDELRTALARWFGSM